MVDPRVITNSRVITANMPSVASECMLKNPPLIANAMAQSMHRATTRRRTRGSWPLLDEEGEVTGTSLGGGPQGETRIAKKASSH